MKMRERYEMAGWSRPGTQSYLWASRDGLSGWVTRRHDVTVGWMARNVRQRISSRRRVKTFPMRGTIAAQTHFT